MAEVRAVLMELQAQEPVGIGSRDLKECLLLQLDYLEARGTTAPHVREIIERHLAQLGEHKFSPSQGAAHPQRRGDGPPRSSSRSTSTLPRPGHPHDQRVRPGYVLPDVIIAKRTRASRWTWWRASASSCASTPSTGS